VELHADGSVRLTGEKRLAGSALRMDRAIQNVMKMAGLSLRDAITLATRNPARVGRIPYRQRGLTTGDRADLVRFTYDEVSGAIQILETWIDGLQMVKPLGTEP
jgi:N-acetylglucosamine-6-phosphate deacetylase